MRTFAKKPNEPEKPGWSSQTRPNPSPTSPNDSNLDLHRVLFATAANEVTAWESDLLNEYLFGIVVRSGF